MRPHARERRAFRSQFKYKAAIVALILTIIMPMSGVLAGEGYSEPHRADIRELRTGVLAGDTVSSWNTEALPKLLNPRMVVLDGWFDSDGNCHHSFVMTANGDEATPQEARLVAVDLVNCKFQLQYGVPQTYYDPQNGSSDEEEQQAVTEKAREFTPKATGIRQASFQTNWFDIIGLKLNHTRSAVSVSYTNNVITHGVCKRNNWWLSNTGWVLQTASLHCEAPSTHGDSSTHAINYNQPFCGGSYTHYNRTHAYATPFGSSGWVDATWAAGCLSTTFYYTTQFWPNTYF